MNYTKKLDESKLKVYNQSVATRILDLVEKLRLNSNENNMRRWVWELIQNAKDVAYDNRPVSIDIQLDQTANTLLFAHNGMPFSIDNITFLIEQISTKERSPEPSIRLKKSGKFGTGFLTTHLLSGFVELSSVVKEPGLPFKKFQLPLDRSGSDLEQIIDAVNNSLRVLNDLDSFNEYAGFNEFDFNTSFKYLLDTDGLITAHKGLDDLEISLAFVLAFVPGIGNLTLNKSTVFELAPQQIITDDGIQIFTITKSDGNNQSSEINIAIVSNERVSVAVEVSFQDDQTWIVQPHSKLPKLFCDFPLIGSEDFNFPVVINSPFFNPTEPRNGIYLTDKSDNKIIENKTLLLEAKDLFLKLVNGASNNNWKNTWVLADISMPTPKDWLSKTWIAESFVQSIRNELLKIPLVDTVLYGRLPIICGNTNGLPPTATIDFPKHSVKELQAKLWSLCNNAYYILPVADDYQYWSKLIWDNKFELRIENIIRLIESKQNIKSLSETLSFSLNDALNWLQIFYDLLQEDGHYNDIANSIFLNQNGVFKSLQELSLESPKIPEPLKDIAFDLGADFREKLLHADMELIMPGISKCSPEMVVVEISKLIRSRLTELQRSDETKAVFRKLYLWFSSDPASADSLFDYLYKNRHKLLDDDAIVSSLKKAELFDDLLAIDAQLSVERIQQLLLLEEMSNGLSVVQNYSPSDEQKRLNFVNGWKGEAFVYKSLLSKGFNVTWSNKSLAPTNIQIIDFEYETHFINDKMMKYDLEIISPGNTRSFIQVKSTSTDISRADEIAMPVSVREWNFINEISQLDLYFIARVFNVDKAPEVYFMRVENLKSF